MREQHPDRRARQSSRNIASTAAHSGGAVLGRRNQAEVPGGNFEFRQPWHNSEHCDADLVARMTQHLLVTSAPDAIENDAADAPHPAS